MHVFLQEFDCFVVGLWELEGLLLSLKRNSLDFQIELLQLFLEEAVLAAAPLAALAVSTLVLTLLDGEEFLFQLFESFP